MACILRESYFLCSKKEKKKEEERERERERESYILYGNAHMTSSWPGTSYLPILLVTKMWPTWNFITLSLGWAMHISH